MKTRILLSLILSLSFFSAFAQTAVSPTDRQRWLQEIRNYKHEFLAKELELTNAQQREFFPIYDAMEDEIERVNTETRALESRVIDAADATETETESAARAVFGQKSAEGKIEAEYFEKFRDVLSPRQLLRLKAAERKFTQGLVKNQRRKVRAKE